MNKKGMKTHIRNSHRQKAQPKKDFEGICSSVKMKMVKVVFPNYNTVCILIIRVLMIIQACRTENSENSANIEIVQGKH